jgi:hypothetical protein
VSGNISKSARIDFDPLANNVAGSDLGCVKTSTTGIDKARALQGIPQAAVTLRVANQLWCF